MSKLTFVTLAAVGLGLAAAVWYGFEPPAGQAGVVPANAANATSSLAAATPVAQANGASGASGATPAPAGLATANVVAGAMSATASGLGTGAAPIAGSAAATGGASGVGLSPRAWPTPPLSLRLNDPTTVQVGDRPWAVLGTQSLKQGEATTAVLVLRDESSGQLDYRQSALRFSLAAGVDYEAFIAQIPKATRVFANSIYGEAPLEPADIGLAYAHLKGDSRVTSVTFSPLPVHINKR